MASNDNDTHILIATELMNCTRGLFEYNCGFNFCFIFNADQLNVKFAPSRIGNHRVSVTHFQFVFIVDIKVNEHKMQRDTFMFCILI